MLVIWYAGTHNKKHTFGAAECAQYEADVAADKTGLHLCTADNKIPT